MKYRLIDLLQCSCGRTNLTVNGAVEPSVSFKDTLRQVKCSQTCALRKRSANTVTAADCNECYTREIDTGTEKITVDAFGRELGRRTYNAEERKAQMAAARAAVQEAERTLRDARKAAADAEGALKKVAAKA